MKSTVKIACCYLLQFLSVVMKYFQAKPVGFSVYIFCVTATMETKHSWFSQLKSYEVGFYNGRGPS